MANSSSRKGANWKTSAAKGKGAARLVGQKEDEPAGATQRLLEKRKLPTAAKTEWADSSEEDFVPQRKKPTTSKVPEVDPNDDNDGVQNDNVSEEDKASPRHKRPTRNKPSDPKLAPSNPLATAGVVKKPSMSGMMHRPSPVVHVLTHLRSHRR
jgi:hypothetical protein